MRSQVTIRYSSFTLLPEACVNQDRVSVMISSNSDRNVLRLGQYLESANSVKACQNFLHVVIWPTDRPEFREEASGELLSLQANCCPNPLCDSVIHRRNYSSTIHIRALTLQCFVRKKLESHCCSRFRLLCHTRTKRSDFWNFRHLYFCKYRVFHDFRAYLQEVIS